MRVCQLAEESDGLLPLAIRTDVAIVPATEREHRQQVRIVAIVAPQPTPGQQVGACEIREWSGAKLGMLAKKPNNLQRVEITDDSQAAAPRVAVTVVLNQIPPKPHLDCDGWFERRQNILAISGLGRVPYESRILI